MKRKMFAFFYAVLMPIIVIVILFPISSTSASVIQNKLADFIIRVWICLWACVVYIMMIYADRSIWPYYMKKPLNLSSKTKSISYGAVVYYIVRIILQTIIFMVITWAVLNYLVPVLASLIWVLVCLNGIVLSVPLFYRLIDDIRSYRA